MKTENTFRNQACQFSIVKRESIHVDRYGELETMYVDCSL